VAERHYPTTAYQRYYLLNKPSATFYWHPACALKELKTPYTLLALNISLADNSRATYNWHYTLLAITRHFASGLYFMNITGRKQPFYYRRADVLFGTYA